MRLPVCVIVTRYADARGKCLLVSPELQLDISLVYDFILLVYNQELFYPLIYSRLFLLSYVLHICLGRFVLLPLMLQSLLPLGLEMVQQILLLTHSRTWCA